MTVAELLEIAMAEPFSIISDRYVETFILFLCYPEEVASPPADGKCVVVDSKRMSRKAVMEQFNALVGGF